MAESEGLAGLLRPQRVTGYCPTCWGLVAAAPVSSAIGGVPVASAHERPERLTGGQNGPSCPGIGKPLDRPAPWPPPEPHCSNCGSANLYRYAGPQERYRCRRCSNRWTVDHEEDKTDA